MLIKIKIPLKDKMEDVVFSGLLVNVNSYAKAIEDGVNIETVDKIFKSQVSSLLYRVSYRPKLEHEFENDDSKEIKIVLEFQ